MRWRPTDHDVLTMPALFDPLAIGDWDALPLIQDADRPRFSHNDLDIGSLGRMTERVLDQIRAHTQLRRSSRSV